MKSGFSNEYEMHEFGEKLANWIIHVYKDLKKMNQQQA